MKISSFKRIDKADFDDEYSDMVEKLAFILNNNIESLYNILTRKASLADNIYCTIKDVPIVVDTNGIPKNTAQFQIDNKDMKVIGCTVISARNTTNSNTYPTGAPFITFTPSTTQIQINHVTGLQADQNYTLKIIAWGA